MSSLVFENNGLYSSPEEEEEDNNILFIDNTNNIFSPFSDLFQSLSDQNPQEQANNNNNYHESQSQSLQVSSVSPMISQQFQTLNLHQNQNQTHSFGDFHGLVKSEQCHVANLGYQAQTMMIQRSLSSNSFAEQNLSSSSSSNSYSSSSSSLGLLYSQLPQHYDNGFLRKVCSTGDLQSFGTTQRLASSPMGSESSLMEESSFKVGKYSAEERKERISKYRAKRTLRNFNKTIKYACRKTLADNRPRIRGRFARNDESNGFEVSKVSSSSSMLDGDDDDLWLEGLHEEEEGIDQTMRGQFVNNYGSTQFQYYGF